MKSFFIIVVISVTLATDEQPVLVDTLQFSVAKPLVFQTLEACNASLLENITEDETFTKKGEHITSYLALGEEEVSVNFIQRCMEIFP